MNRLPSHFSFFAILPLCSIAFAGGGFWPTTAPQVPPAVKESANAVLEITAPVGSNRYYEKQQLLELVEKLSSLEKSGKLFRGERLIVNEQVTACKASGAPVCGLLLQFKVSSGFAMEEGTMGTAVHAIDDQLRAFLQRPDIREKSPEEKKKILSESYVHIVVRSDDIGEHLIKAPIVKIASEALDAIIEGDPVPAVFDAVILGLPESLPTSSIKKIATAKRRPLIGERVYIIGYPSPTTDRRLKASAPDADRTRRVSIGSAIDLNETYKRTGQDTEKIAPALKQFFETWVVATDADCILGLSGGPMVNADGEVVGFFHSGWPNTAEFHPQRFCSGTSALVFKQ